ncbi:MAG: hypothetical protein H6732_18240 [Alphaproteobacteria bacterium]|nr:hypothetical protein [Alphaproteobacteria bacterium]
MPDVATVLMLTIVLVVGFLGVVTLGLPLLSRAADVRLRRPRSRAGADHRDLQIDTTPTRVFAPLDLGPDKLSWPSARADRPYVDQLAWPSARWPEGPFGGPTDALRVTSSRREEADEDGDEPVVAKAPPSAPRRRTPPPPPDATAPRKPSRPRKAAAAVPVAPQDDEPIPAPARRTQAPPPASSAEVGMPSPDEVAALVRREGLADAVKILRARTGLDADAITRLLLQASATKKP